MVCIRPRRRVSPLCPILLLSTAVAVGCGGDPAPPRLVAVVDTVDGVERLSYPAAEAPRLSWAVDTVAVIGEAFGADEYQLGPLDPDALAGDDRGHIFVVDRQSSRVLEYDPEGQYIATFGRKGGGPGELRFPGGADLGPGDTLWVTDLTNRRLTGYPLSGGEPRTIGYTLSGVFPSLRVEAVRGAFLQTASTIGSTAAAEGASRRPLIRFDKNLDPMDTVWSATPAPTDIIELDLESQRMIVSADREFWPAFAWRAFSDDGVVVSDTADYVLRILGPDGTPRRIIRRDPPARPTTQADRDVVRERLLAAADSGGAISFGANAPDPATQRRIAEQRVEAMTFAERIPRIAGVRVDPADRIWVAVAADTAPGAIERIDLFERDGQLVGELWDFPFPAVFAGRDHIVTLRTDELGVSQLVVLRVPALSPSDDAPPS